MTEREQFEAWWQTHCGPDGGYTVQDAAWAAWQAARAAAPAEPCPHGCTTQEEHDAHYLDAAPAEPVPCAICGGKGRVYFMDEGSLCKVCNGTGIGAAPAELVAEVVIEDGKPRWSWLIPDGMTPTILPDGRHKLYASPLRSAEWRAEAMRLADEYEGAWVYGKKQYEEARAALEDHLKGEK